MFSKIGKNVRKLQLESRVIPIYSNIVDQKAIADVNATLESLHLKAQSIYLSNLEEFLVRRYVIQEDFTIVEPNPAGLFTAPEAKPYQALTHFVDSISKHQDCLLVRFFFPGEHAGISYGIFPWLEGHVTKAHTFLADTSEQTTSSLMETYL